MRKDDVFLISAGAVPDSSVDTGPGSSGGDGATPRSCLGKEY